MIFFVTRNRKKFKPK